MLALRKQGEVSAFFERFPDAAAEVGTGGAQPLHFCGMGKENQMATSAVIKAGGDVNALDTYGYTPLHRMASNDLDTGAELLLNAGASPDSLGASDETPEETAVMKRKVLETIRRWKRENPSGAPGRAKVIGVITLGGSRPDVRGAYLRAGPEQIPGGFSAVCKQQVRISSFCYLACTCFQYATRRWLQLFTVTHVAMLWLCFHTYRIFYVTKRCRFRGQDFSRITRCSLALRLALAASARAFHSIPDLGIYTA